MTDASSDTKAHTVPAFFVPGRLAGPKAISLICVGVRRTPVDSSEYDALGHPPQTLFLTTDDDLVVPPDWELVSLEEYAALMRDPEFHEDMVYDPKIHQATTRGMFRALVTLLLRDTVLVTQMIWEYVLGDIANWTEIRDYRPLTQFMEPHEKLAWEIGEPACKNSLQAWALHMGLDPLSGPSPRDTIPIEEVFFWWATEVTSETDPDTQEGSGPQGYWQDFRVMRDGVDQERELPDVAPHYAWRKTHITQYASDVCHDRFPDLWGIGIPSVILGAPKVRGAIYQKLLQTGLDRGLAPAKIREALQQITGFFEGIILTPYASGTFLEPPRKTEQPSSPNSDLPVGVPHIPIFTRWEEANAVLEACADKYQVKAAKTALEWAASHNGKRALPRWTPERLREIAARLHEDLPQSGAILDWLMPQLALQTCWKDPATFRVDPVLLIGPPGIGKSAFAEALAEILSLGYAALSSGGIQGGFELNGTSKHWANSAPGRIFKTLARGVYATPVVVLDEVDKITGSWHHDPIPTLLDLLEPQSAAHFEDLSVGMSFDASHLIVIATANDERRIDGPLRSRFHEITVAPPTPAERLQIVTRIAERLRANLDGARVPDWSPTYLRRLAQSGEDVRMLRRHLQGSLAQAVLKESATIEPDEGALPPERNRMGF